MKPAALLISISLLATKGCALELEAPIPNYDVAVPEWEVEVTPGGPTVILNGTVEEVHAELLQLNPNWDADFALFEPESDEGPDAFSPEPRAHGSELEKRTDFSGSGYNCFGRWGHVVDYIVWDGIKYLRRISGQPPRAGAGPSTCSRVSCSYNTGIWWCNDARTPKTLNSFGSIADGAQFIINHCKSGTISGIYYFTGGQVFHHTNWNVIVREDKC